MCLCPSSRAAECNQVKQNRHEKHAGEVRGQAPRVGFLRYRVHRRTDLPPRCSYIRSHRMNFDDQIRRYFGIANLAAVPPGALKAGIEHMKVDLGLTKNR